MIKTSPDADPAATMGREVVLIPFIASRFARFYWILLILQVTCPTSILAQSEVQEINPERSWALVIGVSGYSRAEPLAYAASDAQAFSDFLKSPRGGGLPLNHVFTLLEEKASRTGIEYEMEQMWDRVQDGSRVIIYIAGHGLINKRGIAYFLPVDGDVRTPNSTSINLLALQQQVTQGFMHAAQRILITDMCHAGTLGETQNLINEYILKQFHSNGGGSFLNLLASGPDEPSWESAELGHGVFTYVLLEGLNGRGLDTAGHLVRASQLVDFIKSEVPKRTGQQQNPVVNESFEETLTLSYLDRPGPTQVRRIGETTLLLVNLDKSPFVRAKWIDRENETVIVQRIPLDQETLRISRLQPGPCELEFFDAENNVKTVRVTLQRGENRLDIQGPEIGQSHFSDGRTLVASLQPQALLPPPQRGNSLGSVRSGECSLLLQSGAPADVYLDNEFYGATADRERLFQLQGLEPGPRNLRLVYPDRERRFRVKLLSGRQLLKAESGELRSLRSVDPPPRYRELPELIPDTAGSLYGRFLQAIWEGRLVSPTGNCAWDLYQQLEQALDGPAVEVARRELIVAMGDQAQRIILRYLRGGDVKWESATFREGEDLIRRLQEVFKASDHYDAKQHCFRGRALLEEGNYSSATRELRRATQLDPEASYAYNAQGLAFWQQGQFAEALRALKSSIELTPRWNYPRVTRALVLIEQRLYSQAEQALQEALQVDSEDSTALRALGQLLMLTGRIAEARPRLKKAVQFHPGNAYAYQSLGNLHRRQLRYADAEEAYRLATLLEPTEPAFRIDLADLLREVGRIPEAQAVHNQLQDNFPTNPRVREARAAFLSAQGQFDAADSIYRNALEIAPGDAILRMNYAIFLDGRQRGQEAERELKRVLRSDQKNPFALFQLARMAFNAQRIKEAEGLALKALKEDSFYASPLLLLGQIHFARRKHDEALQFFRKSAELAVDGHQRQQAEEAIERVESILVQELLATAAAQTERGRKAAAWRTYREALRRAPGNRQLRNRILEFVQAHHPDLFELPPSILARVVETGLWAAHQEATRLWQKDRQTEAMKRFESGLQGLDEKELRTVGSTAFNFENEAHGVHQWVIDWAGRRLEKGEYKAAEQLLETALQKKIFAVVPGYQPLTIDSLMVPGDADKLESFSDFEVAHHPDSRIHVLLAAARAGAGEVDDALRFLAALESSGPHLEGRTQVCRILDRVNLREDAIALLEPAVESVFEHGRPGTEGMILLALLHCRSGNCERGRSILRRGVERFPDRPELQMALRELQ